MSRRFVVVSGLPGSGKTTLAQRLASALMLPLIDKDTILERLFESKGVGDAAWRTALSRESDAILRAEAIASEGAVLVSHWHVPGMSADSGTPTGWIADLSDNIVNVHCNCDVEVAAARFVQRRRHPGHLDGELSYAESLGRIRALDRLPGLEIGRRVEVETSQEPLLEVVVRDIHAGACGADWQSAADW